jgi:hypothetical protein
MSNANVSLVQNLYGAFGRGDIATILNATTPDIAWHSGGRPSDYPGFGPRKGRAAVEEFFKFIGENNEFHEFLPQQFYAADDKVFVLGTYTLTLRKTGRKFSSDWCHAFTIRDGKVAAFREFLDTASAAEAWKG